MGEGEMREDCDARERRPHWRLRWLQVEQRPCPTPAAAAQPLSHLPLPPQAAVQGCGLAGWLAGETGARRRSLANPRSPATGAALVGLCAAQQQQQGGCHQQAAAGGGPWCKDNGRDWLQARNERVRVLAG